MLFFKTLFTDANNLLGGKANPSLTVAFVRFSRFAVRKPKVGCVWVARQGASSAHSSVHSSGSSRKEEACIQASLALVRLGTYLTLIVRGFFLCGAASHAGGESLSFICVSSHKCVISVCRSPQVQTKPVAAK